MHGPGLFISAVVLHQNSNLTRSLESDIGFFTYRKYVPFLENLFISLTLLLNISTWERFKQFPSSNKKDYQLGPIAGPYSYSNMTPDFTLLQYIGMRPD